MTWRRSGSLMTTRTNHIDRWLVTLGNEQPHWLIIQPAFGSERVSGCYSFQQGIDNSPSIFHQLAIINHPLNHHLWLIHSYSSIINQLLSLIISYCGRQVGCCTAASGDQRPGRQRRQRQRQLHGLARRAPGLAQRPAEVGEFLYHGRRMANSAALGPGGEAWSHLAWWLSWWLAKEPPGWFEPLRSRSLMLVMVNDKWIIGC